MHSNSQPLDICAFSRVASFVSIPHPIARVLEKSLMAFDGRRKTKSVVKSSICNSVESIVDTLRYLSASLMNDLDADRSSTSRHPIRGINAVHVARVTAMLILDAINSSLNSAISRWNIVMVAISMAYPVRPLAV